MHKLSTRTGGRGHEGGWLYLDELGDDDGLVSRDRRGLAEVPLQVVVVEDNVHRSATEHVRGTHEHGVSAQTWCRPRGVGGGNVSTAEGDE